MEEKPNYYAIIPANIRYDRTLRASEKLLYGEITALSKQTGECWASNKYFCSLYEVKPNAIATWIRHLKEKGYIEVEYEYNGREIQKRIIKIGGIQKDTRYSQKDIGVFTNEYEGTIQKGEENNTSTNNKNNNNKENIKRNREMIETTINYLNKMTGKNYKPTTPNTVKHLTARINEGYNDWDFMDVIDTKCKEWLGTDMEKYLRPDTLFGSKFENYLNQ